MLSVLCNLCPSRTACLKTYGLATGLFFTPHLAVALMMVVLWHVCGMVSTWLRKRPGPFRAVLHQNKYPAGTLCEAFVLCRKH